MNKVNYDKLMQGVIDAFEVGTKPKLLLHSCCAPCSTACIERLIKHFDLTIYYYNPNLDSDKEFDLRASEQKRYCAEKGIECIVEDYLPDEFYSAVMGFEGCLEGGDRCKKCFKLRLERTAKKSKELSVNYFATTLTVSPLKNVENINTIGMAIEKELGVNYLPTDFKKKEGYKRSIELSMESGLYRQNYCGCKFSKGNK